MWCIILRLNENWRKFLLKCWSMEIKMPHQNGFLHIYVLTSSTYFHTWKKSLFSKNFRTRFGNVSYRFVRILALKQGQDTSVKYFCHFQDGEVVIEANYHEIWVSAWHPHPPEGNLLEGIDNKTIIISICLHRYVLFSVTHSLSEKSCSF